MTFLMNEARAFGLKCYKVRLESVLFRFLQDTDIPAPRIKQAMHYVLFPAGKALRPTLVYLCGELLDVSQGCLDILAASIELTHCYSLVHDDLPAMDNDDFRRGKLSCHRAFDEATAILAGDAMQAFAIELLLSELPKFVTSEQVIAITGELVRATGVSGMVSGQSLDLSELSNPHLSESDLKKIHNLKTGKLIKACVNMVLSAAIVEEGSRRALQNYACHLGLVFQMQDDYLDAFAPTDVLGKQRSSDEVNNKRTFAKLYTQPDLLGKIRENYHLAKEALKPFDSRALPLLELTDWLLARSA